jgi:hypothetical protein
VTGPGFTASSGAYFCKAPVTLLIYSLLQPLPSKHLKQRYSWNQTFFNQSHKIRLLQGLTALTNMSPPKPNDHPIFTEPAPPSHSDSKKHRPRSPSPYPPPQPLIPEEAFLDRVNSHPIFIIDRAPSLPMTGKPRARSPSPYPPPQPPIPAEAFLSDSQPESVPDTNEPRAS